MGDRRAFQAGSLEYFQLLDRFMITVSLEVVGKGLESPLFHIFSETLVPCPSEETGLFDEFPTWPVELDQVREEVNHDFCRHNTYLPTTNISDVDVFDCGHNDSWEERVASFFFPDG